MSGDLPDWPVLTALTNAVVAAHPDLSSRMAQAIREDLPFYRSDRPVSLNDIEESTRAHLASITSPASTELERDAAPRELGERRARMGVDLNDVTDALRSGTKFLWDRIVDFARSDGAVSDSELVDLASQIWFMHDAFVQAMAGGYRSEYAKRLLSRQQERLGILYGLLTARGQEASSPWNAVDRLGLPRSGGYVIVAVAASQTGRMPLPRIEHVLAESQITSAWVMTGNVQLGVVSTRDPAWTDALAGGTAQRTVTAGVSPPHEDFAEIGLAVRLARVALAAAPPNTVSYFTDAPIPMTAAGSPEVSGPIVITVLGALLHQPEAERDTLIDTLDAWFSADGVLSDVAAQLWIHQNTVRNRLRRIAALTGRDVAFPRQAAELYLALSVYRRQSDHR